MNALRITRAIAAQHAANEASRNTLNRCKVFATMKRIKQIPKRRMSDEVLKRICGENLGMS